MIVLVVFTQTIIFRDVISWKEILVKTQEIIEIWVKV